ncbi:MAG: PFL family protein [Clostridia bacterium]|nr:PFL family protein [Clostridia bacterium]
MISAHEVMQTLEMFDHQHLDVRTITLGISLQDCAHPVAKIAAQRIYDKITHTAERLPQVSHDISRQFGVPIINRRISVTPIAQVAAASETEDYVIFAQALQRAADTVGVDFIGGFSALVHKGMTRADEKLIRSIPEALAVTKNVCSSVNVGSTRAGINMDAVRLMGEIIKLTAERTKDDDGLGCAKLVVFANAVEDNPFMAGAFHGVGEGESVVNVGVSGPGVVKHALEKLTTTASFDDVAETIKKTAFQITRMGQLVAREASKRLNVPFGIVDLSLAPTPARGDSVARILEEMGLEVCGTHGTTAALALLNDAVKKGGVMASSHVGGLSGAFIPVSEDEGMIAAVENGTLTLEKLEAMTCVCSVGLDMIAVPGDTSAQTLSAIIADEAAIGVVNNKTTAVRVIPAPGKTVGDSVSFGGLLGTAPVMPVHNESSEVFIHRGGRIPAPLHSLRN